jgi:hypothetical protein
MAAGRVAAPALAPALAEGSGDRSWLGTDSLLGRDSGGELDGDQDEGQSEIARPEGRRCHEHQLELNYEESECGRVAV